MLPILESSLVFAQSKAIKLTREEENIINIFLERVVPTQQTEQISVPNIITLTNTPRKLAYA